MSDVCSKRICENCRFWQRWIHNAPSPGHGECRISAPEVFTLNDGDSTKLRTKFPTVTADMWCGEWEEKTKVEDGWSKMEIPPLIGPLTTGKKP